MSRGTRLGLTRILPVCAGLAPRLQFSSLGGSGNRPALRFFRDAAEGPGPPSRHWIRGAMRVKPCGLSLF